jgi:ABC-2 type transport system permease protein
MSSQSTTPAPPAAAAAWRRVVSQAAFETRMILRNGEQLLVTIFLPVLVLVGLARSGGVELTTGGAARIDVVAPGVLALAVMSTAFTSQAIATSFDRRNGVLRLLATTPLGRRGLLAGKFLAVAAVEAVQVVVIGGTGLALGWRPVAAGILLALVALVLGTAAFISLALLVAGTLRAEAVLAGANLLLVVLAVGSGVVVPVSQLPGPLEHVARLLPSGALGEALRGALIHGTLPAWSVGVLLAWTAVLAWSAARLFRWH